ncbi:carboxylate-amine ligase [Nitrobacter vulgaris]|uniref:carboxylate-amine ligase n=1 Tax=Nitrobacter vulgaris TaxID=29421 RepID=UPI00285F512C|nr:carboxylate-amine ligase [Nitrobacter vulgaris]MDR6305676.1 carboxylate-amine ligase [Nitrobacter vulgaris]
MQFDPKILKTLRLNLSRDGGHLIIRSAAGREEVSEYSFGIEEEYFLADRETFEVAMQTPNELFEAANWSTGDLATREMLQAQLEVATNIHGDINDAREELKFLRREVAAVASQYGFVIMASATHPTASWRLSQPSPKVRYEEMIEDFKAVGHRNMVCGMHVHVQLPDADRRFAVMRAMIPYLPIFIALSTSSPFWNSADTGLKGYRLAAYDELPRSGLPELFENKQEFEEYVAALVKSGVMPDESYVWWGLRPSSRHPTLELRAPDVCTYVDDAVAIAALYRSLARYLYERPELSKRVTGVDRAIAVENKWRAQRYGISCIFVGKDGPVEIHDVLSTLIEQISEDAAKLTCQRELEDCKRILERGSSADAQLRIYRDNALNLTEVNRWIAETTAAGQMGAACSATEKAVI